MSTDPLRWSERGHTPPVRHSHPLPFYRPPEQWPAWLIHEAVDLWTNNHALAAIVIARAALERYLILLTDQPQQTRAHYCISLLRSSGKINQRTKRQLVRLLRYANRAAHAQPISLAMAGRFLHATFAFIGKGGAS